MVIRLTIILPTYNNDKTLDACLKSIYSQDIDLRELEVLLIDGGSTDRTLTIARKYPLEIVKNPDRIEEKARILGIKRARGAVVAFIDADNVLVGKDWIRKMLAPFDDTSIVFADTLYYSYRPNDMIRVKYHGLIGGDDPLAMYLGLYSRWSYITNDWTDYPYTSEDVGDYLKIRLLDKNLVPAMGSNGFLVRTKVIRKFVKDRFIHSDVVYWIINSGKAAFAKVKTGIIHDQRTFFSNKARRIKRRLTHTIAIAYNYGLTSGDMIKTALYIAFIFPVLFDALKGFVRKPTLAWVFHPVACFGCLGQHVWYNAKAALGLRL